MRKSLWLTVVATLLGLLTFAPVEAAALNLGTSPPVQPHITAITDGALCFDPTNCKITANLTYNTDVGIAGNVIPDFAFVDITSRTTCPVQAVTTSPPPAGALGPLVTNTLYLRTWCAI